MTLYDLIDASVFLSSVDLVADFNPLNLISLSNIAVIFMRDWAVK